MVRRKAQAADDEEDRRYGKDKRGDELPEELAFESVGWRRYGKPWLCWKPRPGGCRTGRGRRW